MSEKQCTKCGVVYPATTEYFHKHRKWLRPDCKKCKNNQSKREYNLNKPERMEYKRLQQQKYRENPVYRMREAVSKHVHRAVTKQGSSKDNQTWEALPYTPDDLREHLESQFDENMSWDNYGSYWHIDHIYPQSRLPYDSLEHENFQLCWSLSNLQPLEATENIRKSNKIIE